VRQSLRKDRWQNNSNIEPM